MQLKTPKPPIWNSLKDYIYKNYGQESGKMIVHAGVITWAVSTLSQVIAVAINDKIPQEQKKFLIPQEIADGAINIVAFYAVTNSLKTIASKLVSTGKWSTSAIRNFVEKSEFSKTIKMGDLGTNLSKTFKEDKEFHGHYDKFKGGMEMIASTIGSVAASNIATPFIRNAWGAKQQKTSLEKDRNKGNATLPTTPVSGNTLQIKNKITFHKQLVQGGGQEVFRGSMRI